MALVEVPPEAVGGPPAEPVEFEVKHLTPGCTPIVCMHKSGSDFLLHHSITGEFVKFRNWASVKLGFKNGWAWVKCDQEKAEWANTLFTKSLWSTPEGMSVVSVLQDEEGRQRKIRTQLEQCRFSYSTIPLNWDVDMKLKITPCSKLFVYRLQIPRDQFTLYWSVPDLQNYIDFSVKTNRIAKWACQRAGAWKKLLTKYGFDTDGLRKPWTFEDAGKTKDYVFVVIRYI